MKVRIGFVSNSSSSSFVLGKSYMTPEQIKKFSKFMKNYYDRNNYDDETSIGETEFYFQGTISHHNDTVRDFLDGIGVDSRYISYHE